MRLTIAFVAFAALCGSAAAQQKVCPGNADPLGVARTVEVDTTGGPGFGFEHYKAHDFLAMKEVVLTFDDGPQKLHTEAVLAALAAHCTKATFFSIGKMALGYPEIIRKVAADGHTIGTHTWSHQDLRKKQTGEAAIDEIERGVSAVRRAVGGPIAPFFRYPFLADSKESLAHLQKRNVAIFSTDIDSFDFKFRSPEQTVKSVIDKLEKKGKGIVLLHDVQPVTGKAVPLLLAELKAKGYKVVHMKAKGELKSLPEFDALIEKDVKGLPVAGTERPTSSVVRTIEEPKAAATLPATPAAAAPRK
jgi:peptidoglycan/xylan/chitin deacetylase (PgdA/CDA1 family)